MSFKNHRRRIRLPLWRGRAKLHVKIWNPLRPHYNPGAKVEDVSPSLFFLVNFNIFVERQNETRAMYRERKRERETKKRGKGRKWKRNLSGDSLPSFACIRICRLSGDHGIGLAVVAVVVVVVRPLAVPSTWSMAIERSSCRLPRCWQVVQASGAGAAVWIAGRQESLGERRPRWWCMLRICHSSRPPYPSLLPITHTLTPRTSTVLCLLLCEVLNSLASL